MRDGSKQLTREIGDSVAIHLGVVLLLVFGAGVAVKVSEPLRMPGTRDGERMLLSYSPGGKSATGELVAKHLPTRHASPKPLPSAPQVQAPSTAPQMAEAGPGTSGASGLGDGDIRIALPQFNPRPQPDLSSLPHGASGNVVVDVVIDNEGRVATLTLVKGLGRPIDDAVLQTVHTWVFTPASKDGKVIASEQEILVHYDRG